MSKRRNVHPDHYKTRGSLRQGEDVVHDQEREKLGGVRARQVSSKTGKRSSARKEASARHGFGPVPPARPVGGASGKGEAERPGRKAARKPTTRESGGEDEEAE
jgi:hypothetical protein